MKKNHSLSRSYFIGLTLMGVGAMMVTSCAVDGFDDENFESPSGITLEVPTEEEIVITPSADGKTQSISWPVVLGAKGYQLTLIDESNPEAPILDNVFVDGCSYKTDREEDVNYKLTFSVVDNPEKDNHGTGEVVVKSFSTFTPTYATIPADAAGTDLNQYFAENPIPEQALMENVNYDLEAGGQYYISAPLDFDGYHVTLRSNSKSNHAKVLFTAEGACIMTTAPMGIKYIDFDVNNTLGGKNGVFGFSKETTVASAASINPTLYKWEGPVIEQPIQIASCNFDNVDGYFFWDNKVKTCVMNLVIDNCVVHLTPSTAIKAGVIWTNKGGHINELSITNSTFYESPDCTGDIYYFYQSGMDRVVDVYTDESYAKGVGNKVAYNNSTFYHIGWNQGEWGNYNGMAGKDFSWWEMQNCIFVDCSTKGSVPRRFLHGKQNQPHVLFNYNTYMKADGTFQDIKDDGSHEYDLSGTWIEEDPVFANPAQGDFHISGAGQVAHKTGDPRWLPTAE
ncbi:MAG: DUF4957 domain-containing protein [Prevotella sp.]|nr:DUF4957 domain-containing protein [Prevotella sp.]